MAWISGNYYLSLAQMQNNAPLVQAYGLSHNWTPNAISAILGNMQSESSINPGIWESLNPYAGGYGLVQWTPYTKYSEWAGADWQNNGQKQLERISYEAANGLQWFANAELGISPPYSLAEFLADDSTDLATMANYWLWFYEHPANPTQPQRATQAEYWYNFLDWDNPPIPPGEIPIWLLFRIRRANDGRAL